MSKLSYSRDSVDWVRPADWLSLPTITAADSKFVGLIAIFEHGNNFLALTATGNFTVDWGDGSATENISSGVTAQHQYTYSSISASTICSRGYKQCIVTIIPNGGNLASINLQKRHSTASANPQESGWLDIALSLTAGAASRALTISANSPAIEIGLLESALLFNTETITSFFSLFAYCTGLENINLFNTAGATSFLNMFAGCSNLKSIPLLNSSSVQDFGGMFYNCFNLRNIPLLNTVAGTNFSYMCMGCSSLKSIPSFNTSAATNFSYMFYSCAQITTIPVLASSLVTDFTNMFRNCYSLINIPAISFTAATTHSGMFIGCFSICKSLATDTKIDISYANCNLSATALNEIYTNLATVTSKTITVTSNYGTASDDPTIATAKGWTVTS
jgi:surface protein